ncbi:hypothetical protein [Scleromatobacter humisilvae]|uniref:Uncharacterized protein n=1 Tax=Scleromatobacter humisilvae TaxID=2897159 RepID=A0A9X1YKB8_9BURK|nr:hypothetical protein [Scleromatobacter humisilvae]MCK9687282.1 hypothetical protein [Scleromatobacter humisilvae]
MFGFGKKPDHSGVLLEFLVDVWKLKPRIAGAFIVAYAKEVSARYERGTAAAGTAASSMNAGARLAAFAMGDDPRKFAVMAQAYDAFTGDLRLSRHAGTDVELAIWSILWNDSELLRQIDAALADFVVEQQPTKYPDIDLLAFD